MVFTEDDFYGMHIRLMKDLDLNGTVHNWKPIGNTSSNKFKGTFDGGSYTISNMTVRNACAGLFGYIDTATIKNVGVVNVSVITTSSVTSAGGLAGQASGSITNSTALNPWVNATSSSTINIGRFVGSGTASGCYAWRHMELNESGTITKSVSEPNGKNATNASTGMIWNNSTFYQGLGWTFDSGGNWKMSNKPNYRLPVLAWQSSAPAADASPLNITHKITLSVTGNGGTITSTPDSRDGARITFTITGTPSTFTDNHDDKKSEIDGDNTYTITDVTMDHILPHIFRQVCRR